MERAIRKMDVDQAVAALDALSHPIRLHAVIRMINSGSAGVAAGQLAAMGDVRQNNMSQHLAILSRAGIVATRRDKKSIIYTANRDRLLELALFVKEPKGKLDDAAHANEGRGNKMGS